MQRCCSQLASRSCRILRSYFINPCQRFCSHFHCSPHSCQRLRLWFVRTALIACVCVKLRQQISGSMCSSAIANDNNFLTSNATFHHWFSDRSHLCVCHAFKLKVRDRLAWITFSNTYSGTISSSIKNRCWMRATFSSIARLRFQTT